MADALARVTHTVQPLRSQINQNNNKRLTLMMLQGSVGSWELFTLCHFTRMKHLQVMPANVTFKLLTNHQISRLPMQLLLLTLCGEFRGRVAQRSYPWSKQRNEKKVSERVERCCYNVTVRISLVAGIDPLVEHRSDLDRY